jgi:hypothetical protein
MQTQGALMNIELRNLKVYPALSEETRAYSADVYIDEKKAFSAENSGKGGSDIYYPYGASGLDDLHKAEQYAESLPAEKVDDMTEVSMDLDLLISRKISENEHAKALKSQATKLFNKIAVLDDGKLRTFAEARYKKGMDLTPYEEALKNKDAILLNNLDRHIAISVIAKLIDGDMSLEQQLDAASEILVNEGVDEELVGMASGVEMTHSLRM